jgi:diadenosine tetraphosphate (Ap4A) HIT family hydrolase
MSFVLHPQLVADTALITDWPLCRVLLMNDARFLWIILVPRRANLTEMHDLTDSDAAALAGEIRRASKSLQHRGQNHGGCDKINIAAIGNIVPQLHVHIVARRKNDAAWPFPVWGRGAPVRYSADELARQVTALSAAFF